MKTKLILNIYTDEKDSGQLNVKYQRKDIQAPKTKDEEMLIKYIEMVVRTCVDNGFLPGSKKDDKDGK